MRGGWLLWRRRPSLGHAKKKRGIFALVGWAESWGSEGGYHPKSLILLNFFEMKGVCFWLEPIEEPVMPAL